MSALLKLLPLWGKAAGILLIAGSLFGAYKLWETHVYRQGYDAAIADIAAENQEATNRLMRNAIASVLVALLPACGGNNQPASVSGLTKVFEAPPHEIRGATPVDQVWIDETIDVGQATLGCR